MSLLKTTRKKSSSNVKMLHFCFANNTMLLNMNFFLSIYQKNNSIYLQRKKVFSTFVDEMMYVNLTIRFF